MEELEALLGTSTTTESQAAEGEKKKKKKKAAKEEGEAESKPVEEAKEEAKEEAQPVVELTPEQKEAALKEALKKRNAAGQKQSGKSAALLAAQIEKADRKQKSKKGKADDYDR